MSSFALNLGTGQHLVLLAWCVALLPLSCVSAEDTETGCKLWQLYGTTDVCCVNCKPGNRLVHRCGPDPKQLCTPCEEGTYAEEPSTFSCKPCTKCTGAFLLKQSCTSSRDSECGCRSGYICGDGRCSFCVPQCGKGEEPTDLRSCQKCPQGTFNDQIHQKCKPWTSRCPHPNEHIVASGNAVSDIKCSTNDSNHSAPEPITRPSRNSENTDNTGWVVAFSCAVFLLIIISSISSIIFYKLVQNKRPPKTPHLPIIRTPTTDEPHTLVSCSCHQPQQEQGSSLESLTSQESKDPLLNDLRLDMTA